MDAEAVVSQRKIYANAEQMLRASASKERSEWEVGEAVQAEAIHYSIVVTFHKFHLNDDKITIPPFQVIQWKEQTVLDILPWNKRALQILEVVTDKAIQQNNEGQVDNRQHSIGP
jgi:hypothetical protein